MDDASNPFAPLSPEELAEAARQSEQSKAERCAPPTCPPADAEPGALAAARLHGRKPDGLWPYATAQDEIAFYAARWNEADGKKTFRPISWSERAGWQFEAWPDHRPLFNLPEFVSRAKAAVVICEGEKAAEAAAAIFPHNIATTSSGGAGAAAKTDWTPLAGRSILIWPDHDAAGEKYAREVAAILAALDCSVAIIDAKALAAVDPAGGAREPRDKWDAADAMAEWPDLAALRKTAAGLRKTFDPAPAFVSYGAYEMGPDGLRVGVEKGRGESKTKASEWIAASFEILGACRDPQGRGWGKYLRWHDGDGRAHVQHVTDAALQGDPSTLCASLVDGGLPINRAQQRAFANYLSGVRVMGRVTIVLRTGWHDVGGQSIFVLPGATIGSPRGSETVILDGAAHGPYEARGSLKDWQAGVGTLAGGHFLPVLAISAALAGPLLHLAGQEGGGVHFHGQSSRGKTTLLQAAASVWGRGGSPGYVRAWRATANGLEGAAASATDTVLILDEFGQVDGREAGAVLYSLSNGGGKVRAARDGAMREPKSWRVIVLSTGEITVDSKLAEDRARKPRAGQLVRMLDIPADRGFGVFDHAGADGDAGKLAKAFKQAALLAYGVAGPEFVERLIDEHVTGEDVRGLVGEFVSAHVPAGVDGQVDRAAHRIGLIAAAGELAISFGVTPWREGEAMAAAWALEQWISQRGGTEPAEARQAVEQVRRFIEAHGEYRFEPLDNGGARDVPNRAGWRKDEGADREWLIPPETWRAEICAGLDPKAVARTLSEAGILRRSDDGFQQVRKIRGKSTRVFVIGAAIIEGAEHEG
jgi:putative DNA primase/helicase